MAGKRRPARGIRTARIAVATLFLGLPATGLGSGTACAAGAPAVGAHWASRVGARTAQLSAQINPNGTATSAYLEYTPKAAFDLESFANASKVTLANAGSGTAFAVKNFPLITGLDPDTAYIYRVAATNIDGSDLSEIGRFNTQSLGTGSLLPDVRGWEMVSPIDKNGGEVAAPVTIAGGGVLQASGSGDSVTYGSRASFGGGGAGAPPASQYLADRGPGGWSTQNISPGPLFSGSYDTSDEGVPYQLFSEDLGRALLLNGDHCRAQGSSCAVANPPLAGTDAPDGLQNYYLRESGSSSFEAVLGVPSIADLDLQPADFDLFLAGASPNLDHLVLSSCAALTPDANEVPQGSGCDPTAQNLYQWSPGGGLAASAINGAVPGAALAAQLGALSLDGTRVYWIGPGAAELHLHDSAGNHLIDTAATFQTATPSGSTAFYTKGGSLYRYDAVSHASSAALAGGVIGVLGASDSGDTVYFQDLSGLQRWHLGTTSLVAPNQLSPPVEAAGASDYPPAAATARVSPDGSKLLFSSTAQLVTTDGATFDNTDLNTGKPDPELYLYDAAAGPDLSCVSCNPTNERPIGGATIPGALANGTAPCSIRAYRPRVLSTGGRRVFFDSTDNLTLTDVNTNFNTGAGLDDVYQWEASGQGSCARPGGCISLISSGRDPAPSSFIDASADGSDVFFLTNASLVNGDPGGVDLYDARVDGGFPEPPTPIPCKGDSCQALPSSPGDPTLTTLLSGPGNPAVRYVLHCRKGLLKQHGKCRPRKRRSNPHHPRGPRR